MNRLDNKFRQLKQQHKKAISIFLTCGYPDIKTTEQLVLHLTNIGVDFIELGVPFSDPIADGPTIQYSSTMALKHEINLRVIFDMVKSIRKKSDIPLIMMSYLNPIYQYGLKHFFKTAQQTGVDGVIIPDTTPEEGRQIEQLARACGVHVIYLLAPTSDKNRRRQIYKHSTGFVYIVSVTGVTGARKQLSSKLTQFLRQIRSETDKPLMLGFGISNPGQVKQYGRYIDGVIIGSAMVNIIKENKTRNRLFNKTDNFLGGFIHG
jgi:tryptophan synthase alpha chain